MSIVVPGRVPHWYGQYDSGAGQEFIRLLTFGAGTHGLGIKDTGNYPYFRVAGSDHGVATTGLTGGKPETVLAYHESANDFQFWVNGEPAGGGDPGDNRNINNTLQHIGGYYGQGHMVGYHSLVIVFKGNYKPTDAQAKSLHDNPWQIFEPIHVPVYIPSAAPPAARKTFMLLGVS